MQRTIVLLCLWLLGAGHGSLVVAEEVFPQSLSFKVRKEGGFVGGSFNLNFGESWDTDNAYLLTLSDFASIGYTSNQTLRSTVRKSDFSLLGHVVKEGDQTLRQLFYSNNCSSAINGATTSCFIYKEGAGAKALQTEIFTPHKALDFISSLLVAAKVTTEAGFQQRDFNFMVNQKTRQVRLVARGQEEIETPIGKMKATILALELADNGGEIYRFYIGSDKKGTFPVRMVYEDSKEGKIEFLVDGVEWGA